MSPALPAATLSVWKLVKRFLPYLWDVRWRAALMGALMILSPLVAIALLWLMKLLIDKVFLAKQISLLPTLAVAYVILVTVKLLMSYVRTRVEASLSEQLNQNIRVDLYRHAISVSPGTLRSYSVGDILGRIYTDVERVGYLIYSGPLGVIFNAFAAAFYIGFLLLLSWPLTLCALLVTPPLALLSYRLSPRARRAAKISRHKTTAWFSRAEERLGAIAVVQAFGAQLAETAAFAARCTAARRASLQGVAIQAWVTLLIEATGAIGGLLVLGVGVYESYQGSLTIGALIAFLGSVGSLYSPVSSLARASNRFQRAAVGVQRVAALFDTPSQVIERPAARALGRIRGSLEFSDVRFAYPDGPEVLHGISFGIEPGETVAVVGANGSGKSTLIQLALRLYDPSHGAISIDGADIRDVTLDSLRRAVTVVLQEPGILRGTINDNIRYGRPEASDDASTAAARAAHVHSFATISDRGYAAPVGPQGSWLSGGQRQRLALARALLRDAPILLLDEATDSVDSESEDLIQDALARFAGKRTILLVSHRLASLRRADRVIVLEQGRIIEIGRLAILQRTNTRFRDLFSAQILTEKVPA
jgi:ABC-type multidrug transport system fused ATPase/permease subunit